MSEISGARPVSVVIVAFNEADVIESVVMGFLREVVERIPGSELIVAEDGSSDGTNEILRRLATENKAVRLLQGVERKGYLKAFRDAMSEARNELILFCDASGKHSPSDFWHMLDLISDYDLIIGFKTKRADPFYRIVLTRVFNAIVQFYFNVPFHDINCPMRLMRKEAYADVARDAWILKGMTNFEITIRMIGKGYRVTEIPVKHFRRASGPSRGLPARKIPGVIVSTICNFRRLKKEASESSCDAVKRNRQEGRR